MRVHTLRKICLTAIAIMLTATWVMAQEFTFTCEETAQPGLLESVNIFYPLLTNTSGGTIIFEQSFDTTGLGSWGYSFCTNGLCYAPFIFSALDTLAPGESDTTMEMKIYADLTQELGSISVSIWPQQAPSDSIRLTFTVYFGTGIENKISAFEPKGFTLSPAFPNPFNPSTSFNYTNNRVENIKVSVYNQLGQEVRNLFQGIQFPGTHSITWNGQDDRGVELSGALYFITISNGLETQIVKTIKLK